MDIHVERAAEEDIAKLISVQNRAFLPDYLAGGKCPGYNRSYESMKQSVEQCLVFKIMDGRMVIGDIVVRKKKAQNYFLDGICVVPEYENKGIGRKAMETVFGYFPDARRWALLVPRDNTRSTSFYEKLGFTAAMQYADGAADVVLLEKNLPADPGRP